MVWLVQFAGEFNLRVGKIHEAGVWPKLLVVEQGRSDEARRDEGWFADSRSDMRLFFFGVSSQQVGTSVG